MVNAVECNIHKMDATCNMTKNRKYRQKEINFSQSVACIKKMFIFKTFIEVPSPEMKAFEIFPGKQNVFKFHLKVVLELIA